MARVLVTDAGERSALAACRSLSEAGYRVDAVAGTRLAPSQWSRSCDRRFWAIAANQDRAAFAERLGEIAAEHGHDAVVVSSDASLLALSRYRDRLPASVSTGLPSHEVVQRCLSKRVLMEAAQSVGMSSPPTELCTEHAAAPSAAAHLGYPLVLKPERSVVEAGSGTIQRGATLVSNQAELQRALGAGGPAK